MKVKNRFDIGTGFINRLVQGRLRHRFVEVDKKQFVALHQSRALARHEHHLIAVCAARAQMGEGIAQSLAIDNSQRHDEIAFDRLVSFIDHFWLSFHAASRRRLGRSYRERRAGDNKF
jgi:hypothetical protein